MAVSGKLCAVFVVCALLVGVAGCDQSKDGKSPGSTTGSSAPPAAEQQLAFSSPRFTSPIIMHVPADDYSSVQVLAAQSGPLEWWTFIRSNVGCAQSGYAANQTSHLMPTVDGYSLDGNQLESTLEQAGVRATQSYTLTLNPTPWGEISRSFSCLVNTDAMAQFAQGQNVHGDLAISVGQRVCQRWTYANQYQTTAPGQGAVQVFAGTFSYAINSLISGVQFPGQGTASVKMALNPDTGQWAIIDFQLRDPPISVSGFSAPIAASPPQDTCAGP